ncbi:hypothetical protein H0H81_003891, partial [Sphagnurus paluster]
MHDVAGLQALLQDVQVQVEQQGVPDPVEYDYQLQQAFEQQELQQEQDELEHHKVLHLYELLQALEAKHQLHD